MTKYIKYEHHGKDVVVREDLKGKHREHCLCFSCDKLHIGNRLKNCNIANTLFNNCKLYNIVTPVWECPFFTEIKK